MAALLSLVVLVVTAIVIALTVYRRLNYERLSYSNNKKPDGKAPSIVAAPIAAIIGFALLILFSGIIEVPAGTVGVVTRFGAVQDETLLPGLHLLIPVMNAAHIVDTRVQPHEFKEIDAASLEYQTVKLTGVMNYHIDGSYASDLYQRVGDEFAAKILDPAFNDYIKTVVPAYKIGDILAKRDEIRAQAKSDLQANLSQYHIIVDDIYIANIAFSPEYETAIEQKQVAQQQVQTQVQVTQQKEEQKKQAQIDAEGAAAAVIAKANGDAQSIKTIASAQSEANRVLAQSLSSDLIQYTMIQKLAPTINTILLPSNQTFILDPKTLGK